MKLRKAQKKLARRISAFDSMQAKTGEVPKATDKIIMRGPDAYALMHRPGSLKK